jgi:hypothetical protein
MNKSPATHSAQPLSKSRVVVHVCENPRCRSTNIGGPFDTKKPRTFVVVRAWFCRRCWWNKEITLHDDVAEAAAAAARKPSQRGARR